MGGQEKCRPSALHQQLSTARAGNQGQCDKESIKLEIEIIASSTKLEVREIKTFMRKIQITSKCENQSGLQIPQPLGRAITCTRNQLTMCFANTLAMYYIITHNKFEMHNA
jgi:hypothetical protein